MREIKFRGYYIPEKIWFSWKDFLQTAIPDFKDPFVSEEDWKVMQYTGLKDKNGVEIYEGDIVDCERSHWHSAKRRLVTWDETSAGFFLLNTRDHVDSETFDRESMFVVREYEREVIGNIYEDPELLERS